MSGPVAAPVIKEEMADWTAKGGGNSGIVADPETHTYGFHRAANTISADDYSRWRDPNGSDGPYVDWDYCCAGDFNHKNDAKLRAMHADVLNDLMDGKYPMICEFIGKPWPDKPVYYWARWNGVGTLQKYTGAGHDTWSHIAWFRSRVDEPAHLWTGDEMDATQTMNAVVRKDGAVDNEWPVGYEAEGEDLSGGDEYIQLQTQLKRMARVERATRDELAELAGRVERIEAATDRIEAAIAAGPVPQPVQGQLSGAVTFTPAD